MNNSIKESKESNHWENLPIKAENNLPVKTWENLPIKAEKKLPVLREAVSKALVVINKQWGLPAVIEKQGGLPAVMEKNWLRGITPPYWLIPLLIIPGIHLGDGDPIAPTIDFKKTIKSAIEMIGKDPKKYGVELDTDITGPFDQRANRNLIQQSIDSAFSIMLTENKISEPLEDNAVILLRGVSSWSYAGNGDSKTYNERLSLKRAEEVKKYLMQKYPNLTEDNFILGSFYQAENIDQAQRFQGISMWVLNVQNYWGIGAIKNLYQAGQIATPSWKNGRVL